MMRPRKIILIGLPHFSELARSFLSQHVAPDVAQFVVANPPYGRRESLRYLRELSTGQTVVSFWGAVSDRDRRSTSLKLAIRLRKRVVIFWMGTDVLLAASADIAPIFRKGCVHLCEAEWTRDELAEIGIEAAVVPLRPMTTPPPSDEEAMRFRSQFTILGYVGSGRERFYGFPAFLRLAQEFPDVRFRICGIERSGEAVGDNVDLLGWQRGDALAQLYASCSVFIRIPEHDGFSYSVREALSWARPAITSYPYAHCLHAPTYEDLRRHLISLKEAFEDGQLQPNLRGRKYVLERFAPGPVLEGFLPHLLSP